MIFQISGSGLIQIPRGESQRLSNLTLREWESAFDRIFEAKLVNQRRSASGDSGSAAVSSETDPGRMSPRHDETSLRTPQRGFEVSSDLSTQDDGFENGSDRQTDAAADPVPVDFVDMMASTEFDERIGAGGGELNGIDGLDRQVRRAEVPFSNTEFKPNNLTVFVAGGRAELYIRDRAIPDRLVDRLVALVGRENFERHRGSLRLVLNGVGHHYSWDEPRPDSGY